MNRKNFLSPKGEDTVAAIRDWIKNEIKTGPENRTNLGKFFFGVSSGTIGIIVSIIKLSGPPYLNLYILMSFLFSLVSIIIALFMTIPKIWKLTGETDLFKEYREQIIKIKIFIIAWFTSWTFSITSGIFGILN